MSKDNFSTRFNKTALTKKEDMESHFVQMGGSDIEKQIDPFKKQFERYEKFEAGLEPSNSTTRQLEKDETVWTAAAWKTLWDGADWKSNIIALLEKAFPSALPLGDIDTWDEALEGEKDKDVWLFFEANVGSPKDYLNHLATNAMNEHLVPYVKEKAVKKIKDESVQKGEPIGRKDLEGPTHVDALILNTKNGFNILIEAKVMSDLSYQVTYDAHRNQIARNIDVMLSDPKGKSHPPLDKRNPAKSLFLLLTPRVFHPEQSGKPKSRLYAYKMEDYGKDGEAISTDLAHAAGRIPQSIHLRMGWITWEDMKEVDENCCQWL